MQAFEIDDTTFQAIDVEGKLIEEDDKETENEQGKLLVFNEELFDQADHDQLPSSSDEDDDSDEEDDGQGTSKANNHQSDEALCDKLNKI